MIAKSITVIPVLIVFGVLLLLGCNERARQRLPHGMGKHISSELQLDESQKAKLKELEAEIDRRGRELCIRKRVIKNETKKQIHSETFDPQALKEVVRMELKKINSVIDILVNQYAEFHSTLTPDQKEKLHETVGKWDRKTYRRSQSDFCKRVEA